MNKKNVLNILVFVWLFLGFNSNFLYAENKSKVILATTTSVQDSGLLDVLVDGFQKKTGQTIKAVAVGSGQALAMSKLGEADILLTHSPDDEKEFVAQGLGISRATFMYNDFILLGPARDFAQCKLAKDIAEAFRNIAKVKALFVSRGDNSGTYKKELKIWKASTVSPKEEKYYLESGQGMAQSVRIANEKQAYILCDRSTYLSLKNTLNLVVVFNGGEDLKNYYSLILVNPGKFPKVNFVGAKAFYDFVLSVEGKKIVEDFGKEKFGEGLFKWILS